MTEGTEVQKGQVAHWSQRQQVAEPEFKARFVDSKIYTIFIMSYQHDLQMLKKHFFVQPFILE